MLPCCCIVFFQPCLCHAHISLARIGFTADVEAVQIREHVETCTGLKVEVVKLDTKHDTYSSFHVKATCDNPSVFMDDDLWPEGVRYRWFKPARANPTQS